MNRCAVALIVLVAGCDSGGGSRPDAAPIDARIDAGPTPDGPCGAGVLLSGTFLDLDSTATVAAIEGGELTVPGVPGALATTAADGGFELCIPGPSPTTTLAVDLPGDYLDPTFVVPQDAIRPFRPLTLRGITSARAQTFYAERGLTFDPARAHVLVFHAGDAIEVSLDRPHGTVQRARDDDADLTYTWSAGNGGTYILFPNVDASQPTGLLSGQPAGSFPIPLVAGTITLVAFYFVYI